MTRLRSGRRVCKGEAAGEGVATVFFLRGLSRKGWGQMGPSHSFLSYEFCTSAVESGEGDH